MSEDKPFYNNKKKLTYDKKENCHHYKEDDKPIKKLVVGCKVESLMTSRTGTVVNILDETFCTVLYDIGKIRVKVRISNLLVQ